MEHRALTGLRRKSGLLALAALVGIAKPGAAADVRLENRYLQVTVEADSGQIVVYDKAARHQWKQAATAKPFREVRKTGPSAVTFSADFRGDGGKIWQANVKLNLIAADLIAELDLPDRTAALNYIEFLAPWVLDTPSAALAVADYADGHLYPLHLQPLPKTRFSLDNIDMPWVGVVDVESGLGYATIADTPDDGYFDVRTVSGLTVAAPRLFWTSSRRQFSYPRRTIYHFTASGGYVALAKRYREHARKIGVLRIFSEKLKTNPNLRRLFGAPDVWGDGTLAFARETKAAGVDKMLQHTSGSEGNRRGISTDDLKGINDLGYLSSTYDVYADILPLDPAQDVTPHRGRVPEDVVLRADGQRLTAWLTWDKKQYMKRCPTLWPEVARAIIPRDLATYPYLGRFIDVITAEGHYECYDDAHPLTRTRKREVDVEMLRYVRSLGLVVGSEHRRWWAVPQVDYIEGMMSGGFTSWPSGHLIRPKAKDESFDRAGGGNYPKWESYAQWGIGHEYRIPLWELVFHDCIASTWYWGDSSDFLLTAAPEVTPKKDAFNILYGTIPMMWAGKNGSWPSARETFLRTYRNTCKLNEAIATSEMLSHRFVTTDRAVQETKFADGTHVIVNFAEKPYKAVLNGRAHLLPQNGFVVNGPRIEQSMELVDGKEIMKIHAGAYRYTSR